jgi:hypothetical protein
MALVPGDVLHPSCCTCACAAAGLADAAKSSHWHAQRSGRFDESSGDLRAPNTTSICAWDGIEWELHDSNLGVVILCCEARGSHASCTPTNGHQVVLEGVLSHLYTTLLQTDVFCRHEVRADGRADLDSCGMGSDPTPSSLKASLCGTSRILMSYKGG